MNNLVQWEPTPAKLFLAPDSVHIWRARLDQPTPIFEQLQSSLSSDEQARAAKFVFDRDRQHFAAGRGILRNILGAYLGVSPDAVQFVYGHTGKPFLASSLAQSTLQFNLSHSHGLAVYAITHSKEIGIDVEYLRPIAERDPIVAQNFSPQERAVFTTLPASEKDTAFFNTWTCKEAFIKASGDGLSFPLDRFSVSFGSSETAPLLSVADDSAIVSEWSLASFVPETNYLAAFAIRAALTQIHFWTWQSDQVT